MFRNACGIGGPISPEMPAKNAPVAQLDRALDYESRGQEFESLRARHFGTKLGTPKPPVFALEVASVRSSTLLASYDTNFLRVDLDVWIGEDGKQMGRGQAHIPASHALTGQLLRLQWLMAWPQPP